MSLCFKDLLDQLPHGAIWTCADARSPIYAVKRVARNDSISFKPDILYIMSISDYRKLNSSKIHNVLLHSRETVLREDLPCNANIILLYDKNCIDNLAEFVTDKTATDARLGDISRTLQNCTTLKAPFQTMLNYAFELLMNPIIVTNVSLACLGKIGSDNVDGNEHWAFAAQNGYFSQQYVDIVINKHREEFEKNIGAELIVDDKEKLGTSHNQYSSRLILNNNIVGYFKVLEYNHPVSEMDKEIIKLVAKYMSPIIPTVDDRYYKSSSIEESFLFSILKHTLSGSQIYRRQRVFGLKFMDNYIIVLIETPSSILKSDKINFLISQLRNSFTHIHPVVYNNELVLLLDFRDGEDPVSSHLHSDLSLIMDNYGCTAFISQNFRELESMPHYYEQAKQCQEIHHTINHPGKVLNYTDVAEYHMIMHFCKTNDYHALIHPAVTQLKEYDKQNETNMLDTLLTLIHCQGNISSASKRLFVHYNTLKYRISKIIEITGVDPTDSDTAFRILLSLKILEVAEHLSLH